MSLFPCILFPIQKLLTVYHSNKVKLVSSVDRVLGTPLLYEPTIALLHHSSTRHRRLVPSLLCFVSNQCSPSIWRGERRCRWQALGVSKMLRKHRSSTHGLRGSLRLLKQILQIGIRSESASQLVLDSPENNGTSVLTKIKQQPMLRAQRNVTHLVSGHELLNCFETI